MPRSVAPSDLIAADAVFDAPGQAEWSFEGLVLAHAPGIAGTGTPTCTPRRRSSSRPTTATPTRAHCVPHVAFDNPACAADAPARVSIEMRALALWFA